MEEKRQRALTFLGLWEANFIGLAFGYWIATSAPESSGVAFGLALALWMGATHYVWYGVRRIFWPTDTSF